MNRVLPRSFTCIAAETNRVVQVKYTNQGSLGSWVSQAKARVAVFESVGSGIVCFLVWKQRSWVVPASLIDRDGVFGCLSLSGSNQAREGRLVNALAVRGDEGRDTLR